MTKKQAIEAAKKKIQSSFNLRVVWIVKDHAPGKVSVTGYRAGKIVPTIIEDYQP